MKATRQILSFPTLKSVQENRDVSPEHGEARFSWMAHKKENSMTDNTEIGSSESFPFTDQIVVRTAPDGGYYFNGLKDIHDCVSRLDPTFVDVNPKVKRIFIDALLERLGIPPAKPGRENRNLTIEEYRLREVSEGFKAIQYEVVGVAFLRVNNQREEIEVSLDIFESYPEAVNTYPGLNRNHVNQGFKLAS